MRFKTSSNSPCRSHFLAQSALKTFNPDFFKNWTKRILKKYNIELDELIDIVLSNNIYNEGRRVCTWRDIDDYLKKTKTEKVGGSKVKKKLSKKKVSKNKVSKKKVSKKKVSKKKKSKKKVSKKY